MDKRQRMARERDLDLALACYFEGGRHSFWEEYLVTPRQAVLALVARPVVFGTRDPRLTGILVARLERRMADLANGLVEGQRARQVEDQGEGLVRALGSDPANHVSEG